MENVDLKTMLPLVPLSSDEWSRLLPFLILTIGAVVSLLFIPFKTKLSKTASVGPFAVAILSLVASIFVLFYQPTEIYSLFSRELVFDSTSRFLSLAILICTLGCVLISFGYDEQEELPAELYALFLFASIGMLAMVSTQSLMMMFIGVECMSFSVYVMVAMRRSSRFSSEASIKYFILGGIASAIMLYGIAIIFGTTGTFQLTDIFQRVSAGYTLSPLFYVGVGLLLISLLFKVGAVPVHAWVPDVYQGAANNVTAFMMSAVKLASISILAKIMLVVVFPVGVSSLFYYPLWIIAALTLLVGNIMAMMQNDVKRIMAYSSIAHTGYLLVGLLVAAKSGQGIQSVYFYLIMYVFLNIGMMAACISLSAPKVRQLPLSQLQNLFFDRPWTSIIMIIPLLAMAGIPLTSGFMGKVALFSMAVHGGELSLTLVALLGSVISAVFYIRIFILMFEKNSSSINTSTNTSSGVSAQNLILHKNSALLFTVGLGITLLTLYLGIFPGALWTWIS
ncbi:MAG: NADH-quinone oxidoreductase subunit N [Bacteriovoracaceae bacterium]|nr:NADH-quinone oxidoreductase subunit N [Bacteriovoracaceae bacterium]